ncbi:hypothetical protein LTR04_003330 [Oleoguttula sp. CCFEE 6159]|nr:hypothetical protein LTR04_003330 [Oleoguttula sp. CCFEE 6159]
MPRRFPMPRPRIFPFDGEFPQRRIGDSPDRFGMRDGVGFGRGGYLSDSDSDIGIHSGDERRDPLGRNGRFNRNDPWGGAGPLYRSPTAMVVQVPQTNNPPVLRDNELYLFPTDLTRVSVRIGRGARPVVVAVGNLKVWEIIRRLCPPSLPIENASLWATPRNGLHTRLPDDMSIDGILHRGGLDVELTLQPIRQGGGLGGRSGRLRFLD